jgi:transposase-like protein
MTNEVSLPKPDVTKVAAGRRSFSAAEKRRIVDEASQLGVTLSQVARRYGVSRRVLFRWKEAFKLAPDPAAPVCRAAGSEEAA